MKGVREYLPEAGCRAPLVLQAQAATADLASLVGEYRRELQAKLLEHGAILFRGFAVRDIADFDRFVTATSHDRMSYTYRSTPRTELTGHIYTATEYPKESAIPLHNENAYQREWPLKVAFCCLVAATQGGETPLADMRRVTAAMGASLLETFEARKVKYVRHYRPHMDIPWQKVFQTEDRSMLAGFCEQQGIEHEWLDEETLRTSQVNQGTACHPLTGERVFFNQAHLFHVSSLGEDAEALLDLFGADALPRNAYYGDGGEISAKELTAVRSAFDAAAISLPWQAGDVMWVDNMQFAHGRRPFAGPRKVLTALMERNNT